MHGSFGRLARLDVLVITTGLWFLAKLFRYSFPPLFDPLQGIFDVSNADLGLAFTGFMLCYAIMQFPSGVLRDRIGPVMVMAAGAGLASVAAIGLIVEAGFVSLVLAMAMIGLGTGLHKTASIPMLARVYPTRTGRVMGVHETFGAGAGVIAPVAALFFLDRTGWRSFFLVAGVVGLMWAGLAMQRIPVRLRESPIERPSADRFPRVWGYASLFRDVRFSAFVLVTVLFSFTYNGVVAFLPLYLVDVTGMSVGLAGLLYSLLFGATVVQLVTGDLSDRAGRLQTIAACLAIGTVGLGALLVSTAPAVVVLAVAALGAGSHGYRPVRDVYLTELVPPEALGGGIGLVRSVLMGAAAFAPAMVGYVADAASFRWAFGLLCLSLTGSLFATVGLLVTAR